MEKSILTIIFVTFTDISKLATDIDMSVLCYFALLFVW